LSVDEFVESRVLPQYRDIVQKFRMLINEMAPDAQEIIYRGVPAFKRKSILAVISPTKKGISFSFAKGAEFDDKYYFLEGPSKVSKVVRIRSLDTTNEEALRKLY
jgi:hypothetical protein